MISYQTRSTFLGVLWFSFIFHPDPDKREGSDGKKFAQSEDRN